MLGRLTSDRKWFRGLALSASGRHRGRASTPAQATVLGLVEYPPQPMAVSPTPVGQRRADTSTRRTRPAPPRPYGNALGLSHDPPRPTERLAARPTNVEPPPQQVLIDATPLASGTEFLTGLPSAPADLPISQGPGSGGGVGEGVGTGIGSGLGPGVGPGSGRGFGGGAYRLGSGVVPPTLLKEVRPRYTTGALQRRIQGTVMLEVVISRDGIPAAIRVTRSLDPAGLDEEAIAAVREWRFTPGRLADSPVDVLVTILLEFTIR